MLPMASPKAAPPAPTSSTSFSSLSTVGPGPRDWGVKVHTTLVPSISFADDLALIASSAEEMTTLISSYLEWCRLLGVNVTKVQLWHNRPGTHTLQVSDRTLETSVTFRFVGILFGTAETSTASAHFAPRIEKALATTQRLSTIQLPASLAVLLWRSTVLPQALYGCEIRDVRKFHLLPLQRAARSLVAVRHPLHLNIWRSPTILSTPPSSEIATRLIPSG